MQTLATLPAPVPAGGHFPWLSVVTFAPLAGAVVLAFLPRSKESAAGWWALVVTVAVFGLSVAMLSAYHGQQAGYQLIDRATWVKSLGFQYLLGVDGISV